MEIRFTFSTIEAAVNQEEKLVQSWRKLIRRKEKERDDSVFPFLEVRVGEGLRLETETNDGWIHVRRSLHEPIVSVTVEVSETSGKFEVGTTGEKSGNDKVTSGRADTGIGKILDAVGLPWQQIQYIHEEKNTDSNLGAMTTFQVGTLNEVTSITLK